MNDPSQGVHRELLPHVHLLSTYRFPVAQNVNRNKIVEWLMAAPKIVRDTASFYWTLLDRPTDGTIVLTWQPLEAFGTNFASDGYIWPPAETAFSQEIEGGYVLEMFQHKSGYAPGEPFATHSRRRYRLLPPKFGNATATVDGSLWITHYLQADSADRVPSSIIPAGDMRSRMAIQQQGQIVQKEFMLHDRANWPQIQFPRVGARVNQYSGQVGPTRTPQAMAYPTNSMPSAGPPAKRARTQATAQASNAMSAAAATDGLLDDDEDTSRGDLFDHMTPREVSVYRYKQNHEWMEEILSSPYSVTQILPVDIGLGLRGELSKLTDGIFQPAAPIIEKDGAVQRDPNVYAYVGRLDPVKAEEFRKRATERIDSGNAEIEKMKAKHARTLAKFKKGSGLVALEKQLRTAVQDPADVGPEYWRLEGKTDDDDDNSSTGARGRAKIDDIVSEIEASLGKHVIAVKELSRMQDGGLEATPSAPDAPPSINSHHDSQHNGPALGDGDLEMGDSGAGLLDEFQTGFSSVSTPATSFNTPQPQNQGPSATGTPFNAASPQPAIPPSQHRPGQTTAGSMKTPDYEMKDPSTSNPLKSEQVPGEDWVIVPPGGVSPSANPLPNQPQNSTIVPAPVSNISTAASAAANLSTTTRQIPAKHSSPPPDLSIDMPSDFNVDPTDLGDLGDLGTADEALAGFGGDATDAAAAVAGAGMTGLDAGDELDLDMTGDMSADLGLDDSAFGDAFHGVDAGGHGEGGEIE